MSRATIVIPCYNEARRLRLEAFRQHLRRRDDVFLFVNDGSRDETAGLLDAFCQAHPGAASALHLPHNRGKAEAVRQGVARAFAAGAEQVGFWDADLATPLEAIERFTRVLDERPDIHMVIGARLPLLGRSIRRQWARRLMGRVFAGVASRLLGLPIYDTQCGAKLFRASPGMASLFAEPFLARWIFDVEILGRLLSGLGRRNTAAAAGLVYELPLEEWQDVAGSKLRPRDFAKAFGELAAIYRRYLSPLARRWKQLEPADFAPAASEPQPATAPRRQAA